MQDELQAAETEAEDPLEGFEEIIITGEDRQAVLDELGIRREEDSEAEEVDNPDKPWTIEGMFTDYGYGGGRTAPLPEGDQQVQPGDNTNIGGGMDLGAGTDAAMSNAALQNPAAEDLRSSTPNILGDRPLRLRARDYSEGSSPAVHDDEI